MNRIQHPWFPPAIPKRKHDREPDGESDWSRVYHGPSGPALEPRPTKRLRHLENGLADLTLKASLAVNTNLKFLSPSAPTSTNQFHDAHLNGGAGPYNSSIYGYTGLGSSTASLPLRGEVSEANTSDEECEMKDDIEERRMKGAGMGNGTFVRGEEGIPGYTVYEPESSPEEGIKDDRHRKRTWYEPEKDRIIVLDLDSSEDESSAHSPRSASTTRTRSQTEIQKDAPEFVINSTLLSHISSPGESVPLISREDNPTQAIVLYKPAPWNTSTPQVEDPETIDTEPVASGEPTSMQDSLLVQDDDAMDIDS